MPKPLSASDISASIGYVRFATGSTERTTRRRNRRTGSAPGSRDHFPKSVNKTLCAVRRRSAPEIEPGRTTRQPRSALIVFIRVHPRSNLSAQPNLPTRRRCRSGSWTVDPKIREQDPMRRERKERVGANVIEFNRKGVAPRVSEGLTPMDADEDDQRGSRSIGQRLFVGQQSVRADHLRPCPSAFKPTCADQCPPVVANAGGSDNWRIHWKTREQDPMRREKMERAEDRTRANDPSTAIRADPLHQRPSAFKRSRTAQPPCSASEPFRQLDRRSGNPGTKPHAP